MPIAHLHDLPDDYTHVYLAPHPDDVVFSCGGSVARQCQAGARVLVVTLCTAPPPPGALSRLARGLHRRWRLDPATAVSARLREDDAALRQIGADACHAGLLDALYRLPAAYHSLQTLFGPPAPDDPLAPALRQALAELRNRLAGATFYAPLGVGNHIDHQLVCQSARALVGDRLVCYEDMPYVLQPDHLQQRLAALDGVWSAREVDISATLQCKIDAARAYASQIPALFGSDQALVAALTSYAGAVAARAGMYGERFWLAQPQGLHQGEERLFPQKARSAGATGNPACAAFGVGKPHRLRGEDESRITLMVEHPAQE